MQFLWLLVLIPLGVLFMKALRGAQRDTALLIDSVVKNSLENFGYPPDGASLAYLAQRPFLSARIWRALGEIGGCGIFKTDYMLLSDANQLLHDRLCSRISDGNFRRNYPCACALMQYVVYLCDASSGYGHPKVELEQSRKTVQ